MLIRDNGPRGLPLDRDWVLQRLGFRLGKFALRIDRVVLIVKDESGPTGRRVRGATITLSVARTEPVIARGTGATSREAVLAAMRSCERALRRTIQRRRGR